MGGGGGGGGGRNTLLCFHFTLKCHVSSFFEKGHNLVRAWQYNHMIPAICNIVSNGINNLTIILQVI